MKSLAIIGIYWNPCGHEYISRNFQLWQDLMPKDSDVEIWSVEVTSPGGQPKLPRNSKTIYFELCDHIWCVESVRNMVISRYITDVDAVVCPDVDIVFHKADWWRVILQTLEKFPIVQGFEVGEWLDAEGNVINVRRSLGWGYQHGGLTTWPERCENLHVGFCWAARRSLWDEGAPGIPDWVCFGANDRAMALACTGQRHPTLGGWWRKRLDAYTEALQKWMGDEPFGYAPLTVSHRWHGDESNRRYAERAKRLEHVDWPKHCRYNEEGLLSWTEEGRAAHEGWFRSLWGFREEPKVKKEEQVLVPDLPRLGVKTYRHREGAGEMTGDQVLAAYWRSDETVINLGDYVTHVLLECMGYQVVSHHSRAARDFDTCQAWCGTLINPAWRARLREWKVQVWGAGAEEAYKNKRRWEGSEFYAVRGPRTARLVGDLKLPLGDPGLLIPHFIKFTQNPTERRRVLVPHIFNPSSEASRPEGIDLIVPARCQRENWLIQLEKIATAEFVFSNSLHGCIFAHGYGVPWAPLLRPCDALNKPDKWKDWFEYLGIDPEVEIPGNVADAERWWEIYGSNANRPSLKPMLANIPIPIRSQEARAVVEELIAQEGLRSA